MNLRKLISLYIINSPLEKLGLKKRKKKGNKGITKKEGKGSKASNQQRDRVYENFDRET